MQMSTHDWQQVSNLLIEMPEAINVNLEMKAGKPFFLSSFITFSVIESSFNEMSSFVHIIS